MAKLPVMQSGFISLQDKGVERPPPTDDLMVKRVLSKDYLCSNLDEFFLRYVTDIYESWNRNPDKMLDIYFREAILVTAFKAFNTNSMLNWFTTQQKLANITPMHEEFLKELFKFIMYGERSIHVLNWNKLIEVSYHPVLTHGFKAQDYFTPNYDTRGLSSTDEFLRRWVSHYDGFADLLITMNTIFGNKAAIVNVREKGK